MKILLKTFILSTALAFFIMGASSVLAETAEVKTEVSYSDLETSDPGVIPTNPLYFLKEWGRGVRLFFTFNPVDRAKLELKFANEKAAEAIKVNETLPDNTKGVLRAFDNYKNSAERLKDKLERLSQNSENPNVKELIDKIDEKLQKHELLFNQLAERHIDKPNYEEIAEKFKDLKEKTADTLSKVAEKDKKINERAKTAIEEAEKVLNLLQSEINRLLATRTDLASSDRQAVDRLYQNAKSHLDKAKSAFTEEKYGQAFGQARSAMVLAKNSLRKLGNVFSEEKEDDGKKDEKEVAPLRPLKKDKIIREMLCTQEYEPVCGVDQKTYSNQCMAKVAGVEVKYKGKCESPIEEQSSTREQSIELTPPKNTSESNAPREISQFILEADDNGFYPISEITVNKGDHVKLIFNVRNTNVYYGGLDFRSEKFRTESVKPGGQTTVDFVADQSFTFTSFWPTSGVAKANGKVLVK